MTTTTRPPSPASASSSKFALAEQERRKTRLMDILSRGLPTLPNYVLDLNVLLSQSPVELRKVGNIIRTDPSLSSQVLRLCNSALFGLRHRVIGIEQAAILLGTERLRTLVLSCSVMQFAGKHLPKEQLNRFWHHSFLCALLSERLASHLHYCEKEQAYLGGLLHDIGLLPMWILVLAEEAANRTPPPPGWTDNIAMELDYFGMDHCKVGRWMGVSWNYMPSFVDVFQYHHAPERAKHDPYLVGLVATADQFLISHAQEPAPAPARGAERTTVVPASAASSAPVFPPPHAPASEPHLGVPVMERHAVGSPAPVLGPPRPAFKMSSTLQVSQDLPAFFQKCLPALAESEHLAIFDMMQTEYLQLVPLVQLGMSIAAGDDL